MIFYDVYLTDLETHTVLHHQRIKAFDGDKGPLDLVIEDNPDKAYGMAVYAVNVDYPHEIVWPRYQIGDFIPSDNYYGQGGQDNG